MRGRHFILQELVDRPIFERFGDAGWQFVSPRLVMTLDALRDRYGPLKINDWHMGGGFHESGLRVPQTPTGAIWSQHKFGCAADIKPLKITPQELHDDVLRHAEDFPLLTCLEAIESTPTWVHADVRNHNQSQQIWIVKP